MFSTDIPTCSLQARPIPTPGGRLPAVAVWLDRVAIAAGALRAGLRCAAWRVRSGPSRPRPQSLLRWEVPLPELSGSPLSPRLRALGLEAFEGRGALYLPPQPALARVAPEAVAFYPANCGFRISKRPAARNALSNRLREWFAGTPRDRLLAACYLHSRGFAPRVFDLCRWKLPSGAEADVVVVEHVGGGTPSAQEAREFLSRLERELRRRHLRILRVGWRRRHEFRPPDCNDNLLVPTGGGNPLYVDWDAFVLDCPAAWTAEVLETSGLEIDRLGGLFAPVPTIPGATGCPANHRWSRALAALAAEGIRLEGRIVLDLGTGGLALHSALCEGALWGFGWVEGRVLGPLRDLLLSLGTTRFSLGEIEKGLSGAVPPHLESRLEEAIVFCRGTDRRLLADLPWRALVRFAERPAPEEEPQVSIRGKNNSGGNRP